MSQQLSFSFDYPAGAMRPATAADEVVRAIEERLGWRARPGTLERITSDLLQSAQGQGVAHLLDRLPDRIWVRPLQKKGERSCALATVFWGITSVLVEAELARD